VRHVHSSGRYDRPLVELGRALDAYSDVVDAELVTLTEQDGTDRAREALYTAHGWAWFRAARRGAGECAILWSHADLYPIGEPRSIRLTALTYKRVTGRPAAPVHAATAALRPRFLGPTVLVSVAHLPVRNTPLRRLVWRRAMRGWARVLRVELARYPGAELLLAADFNVALDDVDGARLVEEFLAGLPGRLVVPARAGKAGTHGRRVIDGAWSSLPVARAHVVDDDESSDHRPFLTTSPPAR
jgi:hypothetical protein